MYANIEAYQINSESRSEQSPTGEILCLFKYMMELKFLIFTLFVLFAAFGSIESRSSRSSGRSGSHSYQKRYNSTSANRPWATVPPPRYRDGNYTIHYPVVNTTRRRPICTGTEQWNSTSPCRPFGTIPPPLNHWQSWNSTYPYPVYPRYPHRRHYTNTSEINPALLRRVYSAAGASHSNSTAFNYDLYNRTEETLARPLFSHEGERNRRVGDITVTVVNATEKSITPEYNRNSSSQGGQSHPSQMYPQWSESPRTETATETFGTILNATGTPFGAGNYRSSSYDSG